MINVLKIFKKEYQTLNKIEISKKNLLSNYRYLSSLNRRVKIAPVIKSNAYGHGLIPIAKILDKINAPFFCVDSLYEAYELLKIGIKTKVLIMGYTDPENFKVKKLPFSYAVFNEEVLSILDKYQPGCGIHIFVDTGMHREGVPLQKLPQFLQEINKYPNLKIEGLMSHLASADDKKDLLNKLQIKNFKRALEICKEFGVKPKWIHLSNSDGLVNNIPGNIQNLSRTGLALYGISSNPNLIHVLSFKSKIIQIKKLEKEDRIGYSGTYTAKKPTVIGVLPVGYFDGVDMRLSNKGFVKINKISCPIIGKVSMNITTLDISKITNPYIGQEVTIYNSIKETAKICNTNPYDILVHLSSSTKRIII